MTDDSHPQHPDISNDMWTKIDEIITANRNIAGSIIGVLRECQDVVGYLPVELIDYVSYGLNLSSSEVLTSPPVRSTVLLLSIRCSRLSPKAAT